MHEYARQLFYSPEEIGILFSDEFVIYKKLRPIDKLIEIIINKNSYNNRLDDINIYNKSYDPINPSSETINIISKKTMKNLVSLMIQKKIYFQN